MISRFVVENLKHRKVRTLLSSLSIGLMVAMILAVSGLSRGMLEDSIQRARGVNADIWVKPPGATAISFSGAGINEKMVSGYFMKLPHVVLATGSLIQPIGGVSTMAGINLKEFTALSGNFRYLEGGPFQGPDDLIVDEYYASQNQTKVGDSVRILNRPWRVAGIVEPGKLGRLFVQLNTLQDVTGNAGKISQVFVKVDKDSEVRPLIAQIKKDLPDYPVYSLEELVSMFSVNNVPGLKSFIYVIIGLSVVIGFLVVGLTMYTAVLERTREIGILKALGAAPADIIGLLFRETTLLAIVGWVIGIAMSFGVNLAINANFHGSLQSRITPDWWPITFGIALSASLLGAFYPGIRASRQDPIEALAYE